MDPPGRRLRQAREAMGLSQADIAGHLRLSVAIVDALERDDFEHLPAATFIKGYLRNYAAEVSLPGDELIAAYKQNIVETNHVPHAGRKKREAFRESSERKSNFAFYLTVAVVIMLLVLALLYWPVQKDARQPADESLQQGSDMPLPESEEQGMLEELQPSMQGQVAEVDAGSESADSVVEVEEAVREGVEMASLPATDERTGAALQQALPQQSDATASAVEEAEEDVEGDAASSSSLTPVAGVTVFTVEGSLSDVPDLLLSAGADTQRQRLQDAGLTELVLNFNSTSWVEVHDSAGVRHLYQLGKGGRAYRVYGVSPFKVKLGDASVVGVYVNGAPFDTSSFTAGKIARFTVRP